MACFQGFTKGFKKDPRLAIKQAEQFDFHLRFDMNKQGLKLGAQLGRGTYGTAYKATRINSGKGTVCVKIPLNLELRGKDVVSGSLKKEIRCLQYLHSKGNQKDFRVELDSIVEPIMTEVKLFQNEPVLVTKCYSFTLLDLIYNEKADVSDMQWSHFFRCLLRAVSFLHRKGVYHRDLKPDNIMVEEKKAAGNGRYCPVIIDFGFVNTPAGPLGTPGYLAPEAF